MSEENIVDSLSSEERMSLRMIGAIRIDTFFRNQPSIIGLVERRLVEDENGFLHLTPLGEAAVKSLPVSPEGRP